MQRIDSTIPQTPGLSAQFVTGAEIRGTGLDENSLRTLHFSILPKINRADLSLGDISHPYAYAGGILRLFGKPHGTSPHQVFPVVGSHFFKKSGKFIRGPEAEPDSESMASDKENCLYTIDSRQIVFG